METQLAMHELYPWGVRENTGEVACVAAFDVGVHQYQGQSGQRESEHRFHKKTEILRACVKVRISLEVCHNLEWPPVCLAWSAFENKRGRCQP